MRPLGEAAPAGGVALRATCSTFCLRGEKGFGPWDGQTLHLHGLHTQQRLYCKLRVLAQNYVGCVFIPGNHKDQWEQVSLCLLLGRGCSVDRNVNNGNPPMCIFAPGCCSPDIGMCIALFDFDSILKTSWRPFVYQALGFRGT